MSTSVTSVSHRRRYWILLGMCLLFVVAMPLSALAGDQESIATLRQMGKAFASIAEKASPAVVGVQAEKVVRSSYMPQQGERGNPYSPFETTCSGIFSDSDRLAGASSRSPGKWPGGPGSLFPAMAIS